MSRPASSGPIDALEIVERSPALAGFAEDLGESRIFERREIAVREPRSQAGQSVEQGGGLLVAANPFLRPIGQVVGEGPGRLGRVHGAVGRFPEDEVAIEHAIDRQGPAPLGVETDLSIASDVPGEIVGQPFRVDRAGEADDRLSGAGPSVLAGVKGQEEFRVADDRGRIEPDAPAADEDRPIAARLSTLRHAIREGLQEPTQRG